MKRSLLTLRNVFQGLMDEGGIQGEDIQRVEQFIGAQKEKTSLPWYIRGLTGFGAWIAALFFIVFIYLVDIITDESSALIVGLVICAVAVAISRINIESDFAGQGALALCLAGQLIFTYGVSDLTLTLTVLAVVSLEVVLIWLYRDNLLRFISTLAIISAVAVLIYELDLRNLIPFLVILLAAGAVAIWESELYLIKSILGGIYRPVGYGIAFGMLGLSSLPVVSDLEISLWWVSTVGLLSLMLGLIYRIIAYHKLSLRSVGVITAFVSAFLLAIPAIQIPGIIGSLTILLLGFHRGNRLLMGVAGTFLAYFVTLFYYDLEITLLLKSIALIGSGFLFLLIRYFVMRLLLQQEDAS